MDSKDASSGFWPLDQTHWGKRVVMCIASEYSHLLSLRANRGDDRQLHLQAMMCMMNCKCMKGNHTVLSRGLLSCPPAHWAAKKSLVTGHLKKFVSIDSTTCPNQNQVKTFNQWNKLQLQRHSMILQKKGHSRC